MDRLISTTHKVLDVLFHADQTSTHTSTLTSLMHTMPVAVALTSSDPQIFSFDQPFLIIPPLSSIHFILRLNAHRPPISSPPHTVLVRSSMLPTGKAHPDDLRRLFSKPGPHIFKDATLPIHFIGHDAALFLLSSQQFKFFSKSISVCNKSQLYSLLTIAVAKGNSEFISALIRGGADVNQRDSDGESAMLLAVESGKAESVKILIESGFEIDNKMDRFLHVAAAMNRVDLMEILCLSYVDMDLNSVNSKGQSAVHVAAINGQVEALQFLVTVGSDLDVTDSEGWTPLHYAAQEGHEDAVEFLLDNCLFAKYAVTNEGKTAFALAVDKGHSDLYDSLHLGDLLHRAARINDVHTMKSSLAQGAKVNGRDQNGWTPLHRAAFKGDMESVQLLVSHGARVDLVDAMGYTPLLRAVEMGHIEVAMHLLSCGPNKDVKGGMKYDIQCFNNNSSLIKSLCQHR